MFRRYRQCSCMNNNFAENATEAQNEMMEDDYANMNSYRNNNDNNMECYECGFDDNNVFPQNPMLAQSYVPIQYMNKTFKPEIGLRMGTIFPELVSPYRPGQSMEEIKYLASRRNNVREDEENGR